MSIAAAVLVASGVHVSSAGAAPGDLTFAGCIGDQPGCTSTNPGAALDGAAGVAVTADGRQLYTASGGVVSHFTIDPAGNLTFAGCIGDGDLPGCTTINPSHALNGADAVAVTADGKQLYTTFAWGVSHFTIDAAGNLTFAGCIGATEGCTGTNPRDALFGADGVAVTADGKHLFATSSIGNVVSHLTIDPAGNLTFAGCIGDQTGCTATYPTTALDGAEGVAVTADGRQLYTASNAGNVVSHFTIDAAGDLTFAGCIGDQTSCAATNPKAALDGAHGVAVTADGAHVYTAANGDRRADIGGVVSHFKIDAAGGLRFAGCIGDQSGCTATYPTRALDMAIGVAVTADGAHLFATSGRGNAVSHFTIAGFVAVRR